MLAIVLAESSTMETVQIIGFVITGILLPVLGFALAIAVRHGWINKQTADQLQEDLKDVSGIAGAATKAIENQKTKHPEIAKEITTDVVAGVVDKVKLDDFLKKANLNQ